MGKNRKEYPPVASGMCRLCNNDRSVYLSVLLMMGMHSRCGKAFVHPVSRLEMDIHMAHHVYPIFDYIASRAGFSPTGKKTRRVSESYFLVQDSRVYNANPNLPLKRVLPPRTRRYAVTKDNEERCSIWQPRAIEVAIMKISVATMNYLDIQVDLFNRLDDIAERTKDSDDPKRLKIAVSAFGEQRSIADSLARMSLIAKRIGDEDGAGKARLSPAISGLIESIGLFSPEPSTSSLSNEDKAEVLRQTSDAVFDALSGKRSAIDVDIEEAGIEF